MHNRSRTVVSSGGGSPARAYRARLRRGEKVLRPAVGPDFLEALRRSGRVPESDIETRKALDQGATDILRSSGPSSG